MLLEPIAALAHVRQAIVVLHPYRGTCANVGNMAG